MASNARCLYFFLLALSFCLQTHARDSKFFSKVTKNTQESITISPAQAPSLAPSPSPESDVVEHGYGLYGQDSYQTYEYPPTTTNPTKFGEEKYVPAEELSKNNFNEVETAYSNNNNNFHGKGNGNGNEHTNGYVTEKQGLSDTRFLENGKYYYDINQDVKNENRNEYVNERQGLSDTRFLENGKYFYDINQDVKNGNSGYQNENFKAEKDNRFMENGKYYYGSNEEEANKEGKNGHFDVNNYENENENENENEEFEAGKQGISDTRFMENGKYFYDVKNGKGNNNYGVEDVGFHNNNNVEYASSYYENGNGNGNGNEKEYEREGREGYNNNRNEYHVNEERGSYNDGKNTKKFPNEYDTMEEYDREQGYIDAQDEYVP